MDLFSAIRKKSTSSIAKLLPLISLFLVCGASVSFGQNNTALAVDQIPSALKKRAYAVIRYDDSKIVLKKHDAYEEHSSYAITVLNDNGDAYLRFNASYKQGSEEIDDIELQYFNAQGELLKKVKNKEIEDDIAGSNIELVGDQRVKNYKYDPLDYPITMVASYVKKSKNTMYLPAWSPIINYKVSVESSTYEFNNESGIDLRWSKRNFSNYTSIVDDEVRFEMHDQPALADESYAPSYYHVFPLVFVSSEKFSYEGHTDHYSNWKEYGVAMYRSFLKDKNDLNKAKVLRDLQLHIDTNLGRRDLVKALYDYVQEQTRYIFIALGDGGFAPLTAQKVHDVKYGDCKALSFYMKSLLDMFDISANYVVVHADSDIPLDMFEDFAYGAPGNHIILNVPMDQDTIWLDCTSHDNPFNFLGSFTDDRLAVEVTPEGGRLVRTPRFDIDDTRHIESSEVVVKVDGDIDVTYKTEDYGIFYNMGVSLSKASTEDFEEYVKTSLLDDFNRVELRHHNIDLDQEAIRCEQSYEFGASGYGELAGDYMLIPLGLFPLPVPRLKKDSKRDHPITFVRDKKYVQSVRYQLPVGYHWKLPKPVSIEDSYGKYQQSVVALEAGGYEVVREFQLFKGTYPAEDYNKIKRFFDLIRKADQKKFSISNKS